LPITPMQGLDEPFVPQLVDDGPPIPVEVDIGSLNPAFEMGPGGQLIELPPDEDMLPASAAQGFRANLAEDMEESDLSAIAQKIIEAVEEDIESRADWQLRFERGLEMMGLKSSENDDGPFPGSSNAVPPLISEAIVQFWARSLAELVPSDGPAKGKVIGKQTKDLLDRAKRVAEYQNHELLYIDESWYWEHSRMLFTVPFAGCAFKKVYHDDVLGRNTSSFVRADDFIVPANAPDLKTAPRFTHRIWRTRNELKKLQLSGFYRDVDMTPPSSEEETPEQSAINQVQGIAANEREDDARYELYETNIEYDLPGHEDPSGVALPYIITVDRESRKVLSIYRGWKEQDPAKRRRLCWVQYNYIPGFGFYGLGLFHLIGGLQEAATGALRVLLDSAATSSLQGGFVGKDVALNESRLEIEPGVWKTVDATTEDLQKAFFTPAFNEPSPALVTMLEFLVSRMEKFTATTEMMTGEGNSKNAPVGSTIAMIEQGGKVFSTIHRGLHMSMASELRQRFELTQEFMPAEGYPYDVDGAHEGIFAQDFAPGVTIQPVSDPNIFSSAQRLALAQMTYEIAMANPDIVNREEGIRRMFDAARVPDVDKLFVSKEPPPPMDPVSEIQALLRGQPVQAYPDQNHMAHLQHYTAFLNNPEYGGNPEVQKQIMGPALALVGQRMAYAWAAHARGLGVPAPMLPPPMQPKQDDQNPAMGQMPMGGAGQFPMGGPGNPQGGPQAGGMDPLGGGMAPPEVIAQMAAQIAPQMQQVPGMPAPQDPKDQAAMMDAETKRMSSEADMQLKAQLAMQDNARKERETQQKLQHEAQMQQMKLEGEQAKTQMKLQVEQANAEMQQMQARLAMQQSEQEAAMTREERMRGMIREDENADFDRQARVHEISQNTLAQQQDMRHKERQAEVDTSIQVTSAKQDQDIKARDSEAKRKAMAEKAKQKPAASGKKKAGDK
jgi:hypothetical protein